MKRAFLIGPIVLAVLAVACDDRDHSYVTWATGLHITGTAEEVATAIAYRSSNEDVEESKGTLLTGSDFIVGSTAGTLKTVTTTRNDEQWHVVGQTRLENPLIPGEPEFSHVPVAVVEAFAVKTGTAESAEEFVEEASGRVHSYRVESTRYIDKATEASTYGLSGDEYVVKFANLADLWDPNIVAKWAGAATYLVKTNPSKGDFWVNPMGTTLFQVTGSDLVKVGNRTLTAARVEMREAANVDNTAIVTQCLKAYEDNSTSFTTSADNVLPGFDKIDNASTVHLDPGCEGKFLHRSVGKQWWYDHVLVREDATYYTVKITKFGWIYAEGNALVVAATLPSADVDRKGAKLYAEFTVTETHRVWQATGWEVAATPWGKEGAQGDFVAPIQ